MEFFPKGLDPFKIQIKFKLYFVSQIFISNSVGNLIFFSKGKLFLLKFSSTLQCLQIFGGQ
jgi:hypothetical protein